MPHLLETLFWPRSVAVLGASPDSQRVRGRLFDNLRGNAFRGRLVPVNPSYTELHGFPCYPNLAAAGEPADVALLAIPAVRVIAAAEECAAAGVRHLVIISSGFAEEGGSAIGLQRRLAEIARQTGMTITGPNCEGFFNLIGGVAATFSPTAEPREPGAGPVAVAGKPVGVIAQSGGVGFALFARGRAAGLAFSYVVSTGNEAGLTSADFLDYMVQDERTAAVMLFCEAVRDGPRFVEALAAARRRGKPIIAIKIGGSEAGRRATASHTASLSGWQTAYKAVFARYGVIEANDPDDAVAIAGVLTTCPLPKGRRTAVVTVSGGGGAWMADTLATHGLALPALSSGLQVKLRALMPAYGASQNPVDVTAQGANTGPAMMDAADLLAASDEIDMLVLITSLANEKRVSLEPERLRVLAKKHNKPIAVWTYTPPSSLGRARIAESGLFLHVGLRGCGVALECVAGYAETITQPVPPPVSLPTIDLPRDLPLSLTEHRAKTLLKDILPRQEGRLVQTVAEAKAAANAVGFPVAVKLQSPDILHKTEAGCVHLGLPDDDAVAHAFVQVWQAAKAAHPGARIEGVLVQRMAPPGYELVVGMVNDPVFGPIMMVGWGGTAVELMGDVVHAPAPVDLHEATEMIGNLRSARLLRGFRGGRPVDPAPVAALVASLSRVALAARDRIQEMEFNPVILHADGSGLTIADALIMLRAEQPMMAPG